MSGKDGFAIVDRLKGNHENCSMNVRVASVPGGRGMQKWAINA